MARTRLQRLAEDEEHRREDYLDRQLEVGWEEDPADLALEGKERLVADRLEEQGMDAGGGLRPRLRRPVAVNTLRARRRHTP